MQQPFGVEDVIRSMGEIECKRIKSLNLIKTTIVLKLINMLVILYNFKYIFIGTR